MRRDKDCILLAFQGGNGYTTYRCQACILLAEFGYHIVLVLLPLDGAYVAHQISRFV